MKHENQRNIHIDVIKAVGIILMVFYHAGTPGKEFAYLFHMALFFICTGYCYKHANEENMISYFIKKVKSLYLPCVISGLIVACLHNIFLDIHIYSYDVYEKYTLSTWIKQIIKCFAFGGGKQMLGANWFFRTLFLSSILYMLLNKILRLIVKKERNIKLIRAVVCIIFTTIGGYLGECLSYGKYFNFLTVMMLLDIGFLLRELNVVSLLDSKVKKSVAGVGAILLLIILSFYGTISINSNLIINPLYFALCSLAGFFMVYVIADVLIKTKLKDVMIYVGKNSIWIMFFHYIGFKLVTLGQILILNESIENLAAYPTHHTSYGMWFVYGVFGVIISLLLVECGKQIKKIFVKTV